MPYFGDQSGWGTCGYWGFFTCDAEACEFVNSRILSQMACEPDARTFRDFMCEYLAPLAEARDTIRDTQYKLDLDKATGIQLDMIGGILGLPRQGYGDARYKTFLEIQRLIMQPAHRDLLDRTGSFNNILAIVRKFIGPGATPIVMLNTPPYGFVISIPDIDTDELDVLTAFLCAALDAGVLGQALFATADASRWASASIGPIAEQGIYCSDSVAVVGCAKYGTAVLIGDC